MNKNETFDFLLKFPPINDSKIEADDKTDQNDDDKGLGEEDNSSVDINNPCEGFDFPENEDDKRPVIILLGWAGCQDRYLAKYSAIYEERR